MAIESYLLQFRIPEEIMLLGELNHHEDAIIKRILDFANLNNIIPDGYTLYVNKELDKHLDDEIKKTETIVRIVFEVNEIDIDFHGDDPAIELYTKALTALKNFGGRIINHYYRQQLPNSLTIIEIKI